MSNNNKKLMIKNDHTDKLKEQKTTTKCGNQVLSPPQTTRTALLCLVWTQELYWNNFRYSKSLSLRCAVMIDGGVGEC